MHKQKKQLFILGIIFIIIIAAYLGMKFYNKNKPAAELQTSYTVIQTDLASIVKLSFTNENGSFSFEKEGDTWYASNDRAVDIDETLLDSMAAQATALTSEDKIDKVTDMQQYGLDSPPITLSISDGTKEVFIKIGDYNSTASRYYIALEGEDTVYTADSAFQAAFSKDLASLTAIPVTAKEE